MEFCGLLNISSLILITFILGLMLVLILSEWLPKRKIDYIERSGLHVLRVSPAWYALLKFILPRNQDINPLVKMTQWNEGIDVIQDRERVFAVLMANQTFVRMFKPEYAEAIMTSSTLINKSWMYEYIRPFIGDGLLTSGGEKWKARRKLLTPAFHFKILESFIPIFNSHSLTLIRKIKSHPESSSIDVVPMVSLCTLDVIGETAMGIKINSQENEESEYVKSIVKLEDLITDRSVHPWYWLDFIYYLTPRGKEYKRTLRTVHEFRRKVISERKRKVKQELEEGALSLGMDSESNNPYISSKRRMAFLDLLLHHHLTAGSITEEEIGEEVDTFMFAGHDTTAMGISWSLYCLGLYPDIQDKTYQEIQDIFGDDKERPVTLDDLRKMKYLECVIREGHRLYPPVPVIQRSTQQNTNILGKIIPAKSTVNISIVWLHHDPETYPNPHIFDPERFFPENAEGRHPFAYVPFSAGPRNCIGQKFAMMEEKTIICNILRHFRIESLLPRDKIIPCCEIVLRPINGLQIKFTER